MKGKMLPKKIDFNKNTSHLLLLFIHSLHSEFYLILRSLKLFPEGEEPGQGTD